VLTVIITLGVLTHAVLICKKQKGKVATSSREIYSCNRTPKFPPELRSPNRRIMAVRGMRAKLEHEASDTSVAHVPHSVSLISIVVSTVRRKERRREREQLAAGAALTIEDCEMTLGVYSPASKLREIRPISNLAAPWHPPISCIRRTIECSVSCRVNIRAAL